MSELFQTVLIMSITGTVMAVLLFAIKPLIHALLPKSIQYYLWLMVIGALLIPISKLVRLPSSEPVTGAMTLSPNLLFIVYPVVALSIIFYYLVSYLLFCIKLRRSSVKTTTFYTIPIYESPSVQTPLLVGFFSPRIVLPSHDYSPEQLHSVLLHEIIHLRRKDIFVKWLSVLACALHWFNPLVWFIRGEINRICELACDEAVVDQLDIAQRQLYSDTLVLVAADYQPIRVALAMSESKRNLEERLGAIMNHKKRTRSVVIVSVILIVTNLTTAFLVGAGSTNVSNNINNANASNQTNNSFLSADDPSMDDKSMDSPGQGGADNSDSVNKTSSTIPKTPDTLIEWKFIESEYDTAKSQELRENRETQVMLGEQTCHISLEDMLVEETWYIKLISITLEGKEYSYVIHDYDGTFLKLATFDSTDALGVPVPTLLLFFDTRGEGGQGTHDLLMLQPENGKATGLVGGFFSYVVDRDDYNGKVTFTADKEVLISSTDGQRIDFTIDFAQDKTLNERFGELYDEQDLYKNQEGQVDQLYDIAIIDWNGEERLLIYQYFWPYDHNSGFGSIVSVVNLQEPMYPLEYQQVELYPEFKDTVTVYRE
ncbi:MAG: M56 family metallopeptidase [Clostridium sp.]|nr:M56 family metallopeptidase [Clostridium sp.]